MIKRPLEGRHPIGHEVKRAMITLERLAKISHLRSDEFRIEGVQFIPRAWRMRGYVLCPNITNQGLLYRGDAIDLDSGGSIPPKYSLGSIKEQSMADKLYRRMRWEDLGLVLLRSHPIYRLLSMGIKLPRLRNEYFRISTTTLLHSYGIPSPYISLTSDIDIALFYAVTEYDEKAKRFVPSTKRYGILSYYQLEEPFHQTSRVFPIGLQVFERSGRNKEFICKLRPFENFFDLPEVNGLLFYQDRNFSEYMLNKFDGGDALFPYEDILPQRLEMSNGCILGSTFSRFLKRFPQYELDLKQVLEKYQVRDDIRDMFVFSKEEIHAYGTLEYWWYEFCKKINFDADKNLVREYFENIPYDEYYSRYFY